MQLTEATNCPMNGNFLPESHLYRAEVEPIKGPQKVYIGSTEGAFKTRYYNYKSYFNLHGTQTAQTLLVMYRRLKGKKWQKSHCKIELTKTRSSKGEKERTTRGGGIRNSCYIQLTLCQSIINFTISAKPSWSDLWKRQVILLKE